MRSSIPGPASRVALLNNPGEVFAVAAGIPPRDTLMVILSSASLRVEDAQFVEVRDALVKMLRAQQFAKDGSHIFRRVQTLGHSQLEDDLFISSDFHHLLLLAQTAGSVVDSAELLSEIPERINEMRRQFGQFDIRYVSQGTGDREMLRLVHDDLDRSLIFTLPITLAILIWVFGSIGAALIPLLIALGSLIGALGAGAIMSHAFGPVSVMASQLVVLLVLALGVDYSLFILTRAREEVKNGKSVVQAITMARRYTGAAVLWSGVTVALSLLGLFVMNDTILSSMGLVSVLAVGITVAGSAGVVPSILVLFPQLVESSRRKERRSLSEGTFLRWIQFSTNHPIRTILLTVACLLGTSLFAIRMRLGSTIEHSLLPAALESTQAFRVLAEKFPNLNGRELYILFSGVELQSAKNNDETDAFIEDLLLSHENVRGPVEIERDPYDRAARYKFIVLGSPNDSQSHAVVTDLRSKLIPEHFQRSGTRAILSGSLTYIVDESRLYARRTPIVFSVVFALSMMFLLIAFRSIVVPVKAMLLNCLSTGASFGFLVLTFQTFPGGAWYFEVIESFVPALLFSILFGLSMDYHILLLSRVREEVLSGANTVVAVRRGIQSTAGAITSAACIMISVFAVVATLELPVMKELGFGLAVAVLLDATIIRALLLPATMVLLGKWNWYLPARLSFKTGRVK